jgi:hypothetical protein
MGHVGLVWMIGGRSLLQGRYWPAMRSVRFASKLTRTALERRTPPSVGDRASHRTAPIVRPRTMYFCTIKLSSNCGMAETMVAAAMCPHSTWS